MKARGRCYILMLTTLATLAGGVSWLPRAAGQAPRAAAAVAPNPPTTGTELLNASPFDRITLTDNTVLFVDPVAPRPLPPYDSAKEAKKRLAKKETTGGGFITTKEEESKKPKPSKDEEEVAESLTIHLLQGEVRDFVLKRVNIKTVEYFEDLLLAEGERLTLARDYTRAFECFMKVRTRDPKWKGLDERVNRLLFAEGSASLLDGDAERGLRLLNELWARDRGFPGLADKLAASYGGRAARAFKLGLYALGRKILHDADSLAPNHPTLHEVRGRFETRAKELSVAASKARGAARLDAWTEALRIWPTLEGGDAAYRQAFAEGPTLEVAVDDIPREVGPWVRTPADARITRLLYLPTLARDDEAAARGETAGAQLAAKLASADLGRRLVLELRPGPVWSDGSRPVAAIDVARALIDAVEPNSPSFSARWADLLERVDAPDPTHVEIRLTRATLKPGSWLLGPVGPAHGGGDGRVVTLDRGRELVVDGRFRWTANGADRAELVLNGKSAAEATAKPRRVKEVRYLDGKQTLGAFRRGEVALIEHVPPDRVAALAKTPDVKIGRYDRPRMHWIALDGRNAALKNRRLRRGMSYAIDRKTLLEETLLRRPADERNLVADGVFVRGDYTDAIDVAPLAFDALLARALVLAGRKELGGDPIKLKFEYPATPEAQAVAPKLVEAWTRAGLQIVATERPESMLEAELRAGRPFDLAYRSTRYDEPVADAGGMLSPAYDAPPSSNPLASMASDRILHLLLQLERAPEWPTAKGAAIQLDRECRDELPVLPLWQLQDHYAWHVRLKGLPDVTHSLYESIDAWEVEPWFAKDPW